MQPPSPRGADVSAPRSTCILRGAVLAAALAVCAAGPSGATGDGGSGSAPDSEGCVTVVEAEFGAYTVEKCFEVWGPDNPGNPSPVSGSFTYVYTLESDPGSFTNVVRFELETPASETAVTDSGFLPGSGGVEPNSVDTSTPGVAVFSFLDPGPAGGPCEGVQGLCPGATSAPLVVNSPFGPGAVSDNIFALLDDFALEEVATCVGPNTLPNPTPCSAFFWKLRALFHFFVKHHFPDERFDQLTQFAADNSTVFGSPSDVVGALFTGFFTTASEAADRELATLLLNVAAGELFPGNTKCRLFFDTPVDTDSDDVGDTTVGELLVEIESNILSGDPALILEAKGTALKLNLGIGVLDTTMF